MRFLRLLLIVALVGLWALPAFAGPASSIDREAIPNAAATAIGKIDAANKSLDDVTAKHAAAVAAIADYNAAVQKFSIARDAALESMRAVINTTLGLYDIHVGEELPPEIRFGDTPEPPVEPQPEDDARLEKKKSRVTAHHGVTVTDLVADVPECSCDWCRAHGAAVISSGAIGAAVLSADEVRNSIDPHQVIDHAAHAIAFASTTWEMAGLDALR